MKEKELLDLNGEWSLHMYPDEEAARYADAFRSDDGLERLPAPLSALVPGSYELDLQRAGYRILT